MDLLEYGMNNRNSASAVKRAAAKSALKMAMFQADLYEQHLNRKQIAVPEDPAETEAMLRRIREAVAR